MSRRPGLVSGVVVLAAATGLAVAGSVAAAEPGEPREPAAATARAVPVAPASSSVVCPGQPALVTAGDDALGAPETDPQFDPSPVEVSSSLRSLAAPGTASAFAGSVMAGAERAAEPLTPAGPLLEADGAAPTVVVAQPAAGAPPELGALHTALTTDGDLRGLAATGCAVPASQGWLVGGGTSVGRSGRLLLANPGIAASTVDLTVLTGQGAAEPAAGRGLVLAPGEQRELLVEGLVPGQDAIAVGFSARGARVSALLVDTRLRGITPAGADVVTPSAEPAQRQVVPALDVDDRTTLTLRLAVPGSDQAVVRWQLFGPQGPVAEGVEDAVATVAAGSVADVLLPAGEPGAYSLVVDADVPVLAAVALERGAETAPGPDGAGPADVAWAPAVASLAGQSLVVLPADDDITTRLGLVAVDSPDGAGGTAVVELVDVAPDGTVGAPRRVRVADATTSLVDLLDPEADDPPVAVLVRPVTGTVHAGHVLTASSDDAEDDLVAVVAVGPAPVAPADVLVTSGRAGAWPASSRPAR